MPLVDILGSIDDKIENNEKIVQKSLSLADAICSKHISSSIGNIYLSECAETIVCGKTPDTKKLDNFGSDIPFITIPDMHNRIYMVNTERNLSQKGADTQNKQYLPANSICVSCIATPGLVVLTDRISQTNQQINSVVCKSGISPFYVFLVLRSKKEEIVNAGRGGSTTYNLNKNSFSQLKIPIISATEMNSFNTIVAPMFARIKEFQIENQKLNELKQLYLKKFFG